MKILSVLIFLSLRIYRKSLKLTHNIKWKNKAKKLIKAKGSKKLTNDQIQDIKSFYKGHNLYGVSLLWHQFYFSCNNLFSVEYVPENLFYIKIEPNLNKLYFVDTLSDKNLLSFLFPEVKQPETIIKNINGFYYHKNRLITKACALKLCETNFEMVIKPTLNTSGGKNVVVFNCAKGETNHYNYSMDRFFTEYKKDFIVQKLVEQHSVMKLLNSTSLNTFRVMSYLTDHGVKILSIIVRMGKEGSRTDNSSTGGLSCGVNLDGTLKTVGYQNNTGNCHTTTASGIEFKEMSLPFMERINEMVKVIHEKVPYFQLISWDLAIDTIGDVVLIEYNIKGQDINFHQLNNGPVLKPLLSDYAKISTYR